MKRRTVKEGRKRIEAPVEALTDFVSVLGRMDMVRFRVLLAVARRPGTCAAEVARELGVDEATMCHVVRSMSGEGDYRRPHMAQKVLTRRKSEEDGRVMELFVSDRGAELLTWLRDELLSLNVRRMVG